MQNKMIHTEKNIEKLLNSSFNQTYRLDNQLKEDTLLLLEQKVAKNSKVPVPDNKIIAGLSIIWVIFAFLILAELRTSNYMLDMIKSAVGLSLVLIPVSSILLIILKFWGYEKNRI